VNKTELIDKLADNTSLSKADAGRAIDALFDADSGIIAKRLQAGDKVQITGFGTFETRKRGARMGRNPRTGERIQIPASVSPAFRPGKGLKDGVKPSGS
jgi:DNA-binding protein HU-beta